MAAQSGRQVAHQARRVWSSGRKKQTENPRSCPRLLLKAGGRIAYITCSVLDEENGVQVRGFVSRHPEFSIQPPEDVVGALGERAVLFAKAARLTAEGS